MNHTVRCLHDVNDQRPQRGRFLARDKGTRPVAGLGSELHFLRPNTRVVTTTRQSYLLAVNSD
jgi:hypothetical protein